MKRLLILLLLVPHISWAANHDAADGSLAAVQAAVALANDGDSVTIPPDDKTWPSALHISKAITLQGQSVIRGGYDLWKTHITSISAAAGGPVSYVPTNAYSGDLPDATTATTIHGAIYLDAGGSAAGLYRIANITFAPPNAGAGSGLITVQPGVPNFRVDHCGFNGSAGECVWVWSERGLVDHNMSWNAVQIFFHHKPQSWGTNNPADLGDGSWQWPTYAGNAGGNQSEAERKVYIEDNFFHPVGNSSRRGFTDAESGGRMVPRYNIIFGGSIENHGAEVSYNRGGRIIETYDNQYYGNTPASNGPMCYFRSGTGYVFNNVASSGGTGTDSYGSAGNMANYNFGGNDSSKSWGVTSGQRRWDKNAPDALITGTVEVADTNNLIDTKVTFPNFGIDHAVLNLDAIPRGDVWSGGGLILSQPDSHTLVIKGNDSGPSKYPHHWVKGDHYSIGRLLRCLDMIGAGQDTLIIAKQAGGKRAPPPAVGWPNQTVEPVYCWNCVLNGNPTTIGNVANSYQFVRENINYFNPDTTSSLPQFKGVRVGTLANRPATCTPGTDPGTGNNAPGPAYWATNDGGNWDTTHGDPNNDGALYVCTATNTWTQWYVPYQYPHRLVTGGTITNSPPTILGGDPRAVTVTELSNVNIPIHITTSGNPTPTITHTGTLPAGMSWPTSGVGTLDISNPPASGSAQPTAYSLTIMASNTPGVGTGTDTQTLNITVQAPSTDNLPFIQFYP